MRSMCHLGVHVCMCSMPEKGATDSKQHLGSCTQLLLACPQQTSTICSSRIALYCRKHLEMLLEQEQVSTAERDAMIEAAWAEQSARQEAEQAARDAARKRLMDEVTAAQVEQMRQHQLARQVGSAAWSPDCGLTIVWRLLSNLSRLGCGTGPSAVCLAWGGPNACRGMRTNCQDSSKRGCYTTRTLQGHISSVSSNLGHPCCGRPRPAGRAHFWREVLCERAHHCLWLACRQQRGADNEAIRAEQALQLAAEDQAAEAARLREYRNELRHRMDIEVSLAEAPTIYTQVDGRQARGQRRWCWCYSIDTDSVVSL